jgi:hypothetical protein
MEDFQAILKRAAKALRTVAARLRQSFQTSYNAADPVPPVEVLRRIADVFDRAPSGAAEFEVHIVNSLTPQDLDTLNRLVKSLDVPSFAVDKSEVVARGDLIAAVGDAIETLSPYVDEIRVVGALSNPEYDWRTVEGISCETGLDPKTVSQIINSLPQLLLKSRVPDRQGRDLFTTRSRYLRSKRSWSQHFLDTLKSS